MSKFFLALLLVLTTNAAIAQDSLRARYGVEGGVMINTHAADFRALPGVPNCCPEFSDGNGTALQGSLMYQVPLSNDLLFGAALSYFDHSALLSSTESTVILVNGNRQDGLFEHTVDATLSSIGIEPSISYRPFGNFFINLGVRGGFVLSKDYAQKEEIVEPATRGTFLDENGNDTRSRIRNANSGELPEATSLLLHGIAGISYELPMNARGTMMLRPSVRYALGLNDVVNGISWKANGIQASLGIVFSPKDPAPKTHQYDTLIVRDTTVQDVEGIARPQLTRLSQILTPSEYEDDTVVYHYLRIEEKYRLDNPAPKKLECDLALFGVNADGKESPLASLRVEEFLSSNAFPLLAFIFFPENSFELQSKYVQFDASRAKAFRPESLYGKQTLDIYYNILNIIAQRMMEYPNATLTLTGCNADIGPETKNTSLSQSRAETVRNYFISVWQIPESRLKLEVRNLPEKPSNPATPIGQEENRRVEITSSIPEVLDVFVSYDTTRETSHPVIRLKPTASAPKGINAWTIKASQQTSQLNSFNGNGTPSATIDWDLQANPQSIPRFDAPLRSELQATSNDGQNCTKTVTIQTQVITLRQKRSSNTGDYKIEKFSLVLFEFNRSTMTTAQQRVVDMIKTQITPQSELLIEGYTDKSGTITGNERLAIGRATSTRDAIGRKDAVIRGIGARRLLYPNETPEGRFHCRTVQITVKTPVK